MDCRVYPKMLKLHSLYTAPSFMFPNIEIERKAQVNTLYSILDLSEANYFQTVQHIEVTAQFKNSCDALKEEEKVWEYLGANEWPPDMHTVRRNLLCSSLFDNELSVNKGNTFTILETVR